MNKKKLVFILTAGFLLLVVAKTNYKEINNENIISDSINYKQNFKSLAMYKNDGNGDEEITTMPESGYEINKEKSYCTTDNINKVYNKMYTDENGNHIITGLEKYSKCYIYFDKFANKFWRIIRINGDGTIRLIYDGVTARENGKALKLEEGQFNTGYNNNMHVGFKYTSGQVHGTGTESAILKKLNTWYTSNLTNYADKIDTNAGFCGDRTPSTNDITSNGEGGTGTTATYYGAYLRLVNDTKTPVLTCSSEDIYTVPEANKGNKSLTNPIGLVTADEVSMAGGAYGADNSNSAYYLFTLNYFYWTISPYNYDVGGAYVFGVCREGHLCNARVYGPGVMGTVSVRPVINLQSDIKLTGSGTMSDPYVVV